MTRICEVKGLMQLESDDGSLKQLWRHFKNGAVIGQTNCLIGLREGKNQEEVGPMTAQCIKLLVLLGPEEKTGRTHRQVCSMRHEAPITNACKSRE